MENILETKNLYYEYPGGIKALRGISTSFKKGVKTAVLGPNGAGKSTLFLHLNGVLEPKKGNVFFEGRPIKYNKRFLKKLRSKVGIVFQDPDSQIFAGRVYQDVAFGPLNLGLEEEEIDKRVKEALELLGIWDLAQRPCHFLSYGQKKRVSIAGVLAMHPEIVIFDEPLSYLDPLHKKELLYILEELSFRGVTVIVSTHDVDFAYSFAQHIIVLKDGTILGEGPPRTIFFDDKLLSEANLEKPWVLEISKALLNKKIIKSYPSSKDELIKMLEV